MELGSQPLEKRQTLNAALPFRQWQFWAAIASLFPLAYACGILTWLYMLSFLITPNGLIAYVGAFIQSVITTWVLVRYVRWVKEAKTRRKLGLPNRQFRFTPAFLFVAAMLSVQAPIVPIGVHLVFPEASSKAWVFMATKMSHENLGF